MRCDWPAWKAKQEAPFGSSSTPVISKTCTATTTGRAVAGGRRRSRLRIWRRGHAALLSHGDGQAAVEGRHRTTFGVIQNFFGVGSTPVVEGDLLIVQVGGSPPEIKTCRRAARSRSRQRHRRRRLRQANRQGQVQDQRRAGQLCQPRLPTIDGRRWCFVFARGGLLGFEPSDGKIDFHFPWRATILESVNASNPVVVGDQVFISETYGPGSALLKVKPGELRRCLVRRESGLATRRCKRTGTRRFITKAICMVPAAGTPRTPSCAASS